MTSETEKLKLIEAYRDVLKLTNDRFQVLKDPETGGVDVGTVIYDPVFKELRILRESILKRLKDEYDWEPRYPSIETTKEKEAAQRDFADISRAIEKKYPVSESSNARNEP